MYKCRQSGCSKFSAFRRPKCDRCDTKSESSGTFYRQESPVSSGSENNSYAPDPAPSTPEPSSYDGGGGDYSGGGSSGDW